MWWRALTNGPPLIASLWLSGAARFRGWFGAIGSRHFLQHATKRPFVPFFCLKLPSHFEEPLELFRVVRLSPRLTWHSDRLQSAPVRVQGVGEAYLFSLVCHSGI